MWWILVANVWATTWAPIDGGFVVETRADAPTDARLIYAANFVSSAEITSGPGAPTALTMELLTGVGAPPRAVILPPAGGWQAGAAYTVAVDGYYSFSDGGELSFVAGVAGSDGPAAFTVSEVAYGPWSGDTSFPWGCCKPVRTVTVAIDVPAADPWSYVEVVGQFGGPSQITTQEIHEHLDLALGAGSHVLTFVQWQEDDGTPEPPCFDVVAVSASGTSGPPVSFCEELDTGAGPTDTATEPTTDTADDDDTAGPTTTGGGGCATVPAGPGLLAPLLALAYRRRRG